MHTDFRSALGAQSGGRWVSVIPAVRLGLLLLGLLVPVHLPFAVTSTGVGDKVLGWWTSSESAAGDRTVVTRTTWHASVAGLQAGDALLAVNGVRADPRMVEAIRDAAAPGDTIVLRVVRHGRDLLVRVPVLSSSTSYAGYRWYRVVLALVMWGTGMALVAWCGDRVGGLVLGAALLLVAPVSFPVEVPSDAWPLRAGNYVWQLEAGAYRFFFPALAFQFLVLHAAEPAWLRSRAVWAGTWLALALLLAVVTDGFQRPLAWSIDGIERDIRTAAGLTFEILILGAAFLARRQLLTLSSPLRWPAFAIVLFALAGTLLSLAVLAVGNRSVVIEALRQVKALTMALLPPAAVLYFFLGEDRRDDRWQARHRIASSISATLTLLYGFAVAGAAAIVLSSAGRSLGGDEWLLFGAIFVATIVFSPVLRWTRDLVDRHMFARWIELERRAHVVVDRIGAELVPDRIARRVANELPVLLGFDAAELILAEEVSARWDALTREGIRCAPRDELARRAGAARASNPVAAVHNPDGELLGIIEGRAGADRILDPPEQAVLATVAQAVASALRNANSYLALRRAQQELAENEQIAAIAALAGALAHEIKNPLASLKIGIHVLERAGVDPERLIRIQRDIRRIDDLVSSLLRYTRDSVQEPKDRIEIQELARACIDDIRHLAAERGVRIREEYLDQPVVVPGWEGPIRVVISNLLANALDAVAQSGEIGIRVTAATNEAEIAVHDTGNGIPRDLKEKVFELNFTTKNGGTGLGLALAQREVERLGGTLRIDGAARNGTVLRVTLPRIMV